tara:strand:- start:226 stop:534 length:309 start_codon:yes stop_codon:yes gene_type:complete
MSSKNPNDLPQGTKGLFPSNGEKSQRFMQSLNHAMIMNSISRHELANKLGVTIGTVIKYLRPEVNPYDVRAKVAINLEGLLGITVETSYKFYDKWNLVLYII